METKSLIFPVATSDFVTKKNHGEFMADRIGRLSKWVGRTRWPGTMQMWVIEDLERASEHANEHRWNDAHEALTGTMLGLRFTVDHVASASEYLDHITTLEQWIQTLKTDIQKLVP